MASAALDIEAQAMDAEPFVSNAQMRYFGFVLVVELFLMWFYDQVPQGKNAQVYIVAHLMLACLCPQKQDVKESVAQALPAPSSDQRDLAAAPPKPTPKPRHVYLDNVKIFCTVLVLIHHITIGFGGSGDFLIRFGNYDNETLGIASRVWIIADQSFFMCLLFFVGGIFTPSSFKRKGASAFIRDKLKRLGWPVVITFFIVTPVITSLCGAALVGGDWTRYTAASPSVCWFLISLIFFSVAYAIVPWSSLKLAFPSIPSLIIGGALLGVWQGLTAAFNYDAQWLNIKANAAGALPFDIVFFAAGCIAKENGWLEAIVNLKAREYWLARVASLVAIAVVASHQIIVDPNGGRVMKCGSPAPKVEDSGFAPHLPDKLFYFIWSPAVIGIITTTLSVSVLHLFAVHFNSQGQLAKMLSEAQYGVYVMQTIIIPFVMWTYTKILEAAGIQLQWDQCGDTRAAMSETVLEEELLWGGWLYTIFLVNFISWPFCYFFRKLPGVRGVL